MSPSNHTARETRIEREERERKDARVLPAADPNLAALAKPNRNALSGMIA